MKFGISLIDESNYLCTYVSLFSICMMAALAVGGGNDLVEEINLKCFVYVDTAALHFPPPRGSVVGLLPQPHRISWNY